MRLSPVDADGDVSIGGAQLLVEAAVGADPQVVLCDFHLGKAAAAVAAEREKISHKRQPTGNRL